MVRTLPVQRYQPLLLEKCLGLHRLHHCCLVFFVLRWRKMHMRYVQAAAADYALCDQIASALSLHAEKLAVKCNTSSYKTVARQPYAVLYASDMQSWQTLAER